MKHFIIFLILTGFSSLIILSTISHVEARPYMSSEDLFNGSQFVLEGIIISKKIEPSQNYILYEIKVEKYLKGATQNDVIDARGINLTGGKLGNTIFEIGDRGLFYINNHRQEYDNNDLLVISPYSYVLDNGINTFSQEYVSKDSYQLTTFGSQPSWSPDGKKILFVNHSTYSFDHPSEIWIIGVDGSSPTLVKRMPEHTNALYPKFSPNGKKIAFIGDYGCANCHSRNFLSVMDFDGSYMREIADGGYSLKFAWTADNEIILARGNNETNTSIFLIDPAPNPKTILLTELPIGIGGWNIIIGNDGKKLLFTGYDHHYISQIYSLDLSNNNTKATPIHGTDDLLLVSLSNDEQTIFATDENGNNSFALYAIDVKNTTNKIQISQNNLDYSIYEKIKAGVTSGGDSVNILEQIVAYAHAPVTYVYDKAIWDKFGIYVGCKDNCESRPSEIFTGGFVYVNGKYVKENNISSIVITAGIGVAIAGSLVAWAKRRRTAN